MENVHNQIEEIEPMEAEIEAENEETGLVKTTKESIDSMLALAENIDRLIDAQNKIRAAIMKLAQPGDWVMFGKKGDGGKAEIGFAGCMRIASTLGVNLTNWTHSKELNRDEIGEYYRHEYECDVSYRGRLVRVFGRASSRDKFLGKVKGEYRPLSEIDEGNIKMIARRSAMKEGTKILFGLHHMDPTFVEKYGIKLENVAGYSFKSQEEQVDATAALVVVVADSVLHKEGKSASGRIWKLYKISSAEGDEFFTFSSIFHDTALKAKAQKLQASVSYKVDDKGSKKITAISVTDNPAF